MDQTAKELLMLLAAIVLLAIGVTIALDYWNYLQHVARVDAILTN